MKYIKYWDKYSLGKLVFGRQYSSRPREKNAEDQGEEYANPRENCVNYEVYYEIRQLEANPLLMISESAGSLRWSDCRKESKEVSGVAVADYAGVGFRKDRDYNRSKIANGTTNPNPF